MMGIASEYGVRGELGAVVADDHARAATGLDDTVELAHDTQIGERGIDDQGEAFPREVIDQRVQHEVERPAQVPVLSLRVVLLTDRPGHSSFPQVGHQKFFPEHFLQRRYIQHRLCQRSLQLPVLVFQALQLAGVGHAAIAGSPLVERRVTDAKLSA